MIICMNIAQVVVLICCVFCHQVSKSEHTSFRDLAWDLIFSKNITNDMEKVRWAPQLMVYMQTGSLVQFLCEP